MVSPLARLAVLVLLPAPLVVTLPDSWVSVHEDGAGPADPVVLFMSGARVGGNISPTRESSFPLALLEKGNEEATLNDSSLMGKRIERPLLSRGKTGSSSPKISVF